MPTAEREGDHVVIRSDWRDKEAIKLVPGVRWDADAKCWVAPLSWAACLQLRGIFGATLVVGDELSKWSWEQFETRVGPALAVRDRLEHDSPDIGHLYPFQAVGVDFMVVAGDALLGDELGTGKTITALAALGREEGLPALVICPNSVKTGWAKQAVRFYPEATPYVVRGGAQGRRKILAEAGDDPTALVAINIESVRLFSRLAPFGSVALKRCRECDRHGEENITASRCEVHRKELNGFGFKTVILDEAHRIKEPKAAQTRACWAVGHDPSVRRRWALTGTPLANDVGDLWSIMHFLAPYEWPTKSKWVDRYALTAWSPYGGLDVVGINPQTREEFNKIFYPRFRRTPKALVLDQLPEKVRSTRWVELVPKQKKAYDEIERQLVTRLDNGQVLIAPTNLVKATRLLQLSSSYAEVEYVVQPLTPTAKCRQREWFPCSGVEHNEDCTLRLKMVVTLIEPSPKLDVMEEVIAERGRSPLVIAAMSRQLIILASNRLEKRGVPHGLIVGGVGEYDRQRVIDRFQRDELQIVLFTLQAGGTGVDGLQHSDTLLCLQRSWSMLDNVQAEGRVDRIGSEKHDSVHIIDVVAQDTVEEEAQFPRLAAKFAQLDEITQDRARLAAAGLDSPDMFVLDQREQRILGSDLGAPIREEDT